MLRFEERDRIRLEKILLCQIFSSEYCVLDNFTSHIVHKDVETPLSNITTPWRKLPLNVLNLVQPADYFYYTIDKRGLEGKMGQVEVRMHKGWKLA